LAENKVRFARAEQLDYVVITPLWRSGVAHVLKGSLSFTCTPAFVR